MVKHRLMTPASNAPRGRPSRAARARVLHNLRPAARPLPPAVARPSGSLRPVRRRRGFPLSDGPIAGIFSWTRLHCGHRRPRFLGRRFAPPLRKCRDDQRTYPERVGRWRVGPGRAAQCQANSPAGSTCARQRHERTRRCRNPNGPSGAKELRGTGGSAERANPAREGGSRRTQPSAAKRTQPGRSPQPGAPKRTQWSKRTQRDQRIRRGNQLASAESKTNPVTPRPNEPSHASAK
jgi:hypothetical protein